MKKTITLNVNGESLVFDMTGDVYDKYINEVQQTKKTGPTRNMLMRSIRAESRDALKTLLELPGAAMMIANQLVEEYAPDLEITVGE